MPRDSPRWPSCQDPRPHCVSRPTCRSRPFSLCLFLLCQPPFPTREVTEQAGTGLGGQTRMSHGARAEASEIFLHTESRRPNPHKSVPLAGQERPFPRERVLESFGWEVGRPFVRPLESRNRDSFIKSFNVDDARPRRRSIILVIEGVTLGARYRDEIPRENCREYLWKRSNETQPGIGYLSTIRYRDL